MNTATFATQNDKLVSDNTLTHALFATNKIDADIVALIAKLHVSTLATDNARAATENVLRQYPDRKALRAVIVAAKKANLVRYTDTELTLNYPEIVATIK